MFGRHAMYLSWKTYAGLVMVALLALSLVPARQAFAATPGVTTAPELNVRSGPSKNYASIDTLRQGTAVLIQSTNAAGDWVNITYTKGRARSGWVSAKFVRQVVKQVTLTVVNDSAETVYVLYVSPSTSTNWGDDVLGTQTTLSPGESFQLRLDPGTYDMQAKNDDLDVIDVAYEVSLFANQTWYVD